MNEVLVKGALKMLKNFISPDQIKHVAADLLKQAVDYKNTLQLDPANNETQIAAMTWEHKGEVFTSIVFLDSEDKIVRYDQVKRADELINSLISKI